MSQNKAYVAAEAGAASVLEPLRVTERLSSDRRAQCLGKAGQRGSFGGWMRSALCMWVGR